MIQNTLFCCYNSIIFLSFRITSSLNNQLQQSFVPRHQFFNQHDHLLYPQFNFPPILCQNREVSSIQTYIFVVFFSFSRTLIQQPKFLDILVCIRLLKEKFTMTTNRFFYINGGLRTWKSIAKVIMWRWSWWMEDRYNEVKAYTGV